MPLTASQRNIPLTAAHGSDDYESQGGKQHSSGGSIDVSIEAARVYVTSLASRLWSNVSLDTLRPLPMFLGLSDGFCLSPEAFTPPIKKMVDKSTPEKVTSRIKLNIAFFLTNYALVAFGVAVVVALMHPGMLVSVGFVWGLWWVHNYLISHEVIFFGRNVGILLSISHRFYVLFVITILVVIWKCLAPAIIFVSITTIVVMAHAIMRDPKHTDKQRYSPGRQGGSEDSDEEEDNNGSPVMVDRPKDGEV